LINLSNELTGVVVVNNIVPEFISLSLIKLAVLVGIVVVKDPLSVLLNLTLGLAGSPGDFTVNRNSVCIRPVG